MDTTKEKKRRRQEQWRRQGGEDLVPQFSRQDISIRLNYKCEKRLKIVKTVKNVKSGKKLNKTF